MSLSGSLYLFEQLRGNCVTLAVEDVLWRRTRWTEGTRRGSVAIINEGYFPQHSQTVCMCVSVCVCVAGGVCVCIADGGNKKGWWAPLPWGNSTVRCTLRSPAPTLIITSSGLSRIVSVRVCFFVLSTMSSGVAQRNFWALETLTGDVMFFMPLLIAV